MRTRSMIGRSSAWRLLFNSREIEGEDFDRIVYLVGGEAVIGRSRYIACFYRYLGRGVLSYEHTL